MVGGAGGEQGELPDFLVARDVRRAAAQAGQLLDGDRQRDQRVVAGRVLDQHLVLNVVAGSNDAVGEAQGHLSSEAELRAVLLADAARR